MPELSAQLSFRGLSWDLLAIGFLAFALLVYGFTGGRRALVAFVVAVYVGNAVAIALPALGVLKISIAPPFSALVFLLVTMLFTWLFSGYTFMGIFRFAVQPFWAIWQIFGLSVLGTGFFAASLLYFLPSSIPVSALARTMFSAGVAPLVWALLPAFFLLLVRGEKEEGESEE